MDFGKLSGRREIAEAAMELILCVIQIWMGVMVGLVIGWSWRPRWVEWGLLLLGLRNRLRFSWGPLHPGFDYLRLGLAFTAISVVSVCRRLWKSSSVSLPSSYKPKESEGASSSSGGRISRVPSAERNVAGFRGHYQEEKEVVTQKDLDRLLLFLDGQNDDSAWYSMMERTTHNMTYHAWHREPKDGPVIYRSRTVFEDATSELVRDFFWDDDFRLKWDSMLACCKVLEEFPKYGSMIVHWIKKFPFFCSDREYIIGRRIWEAGKTFYCVTKGVPYPSPHKNENPWRVELYFSSWRIRAVESSKQDGQLSACEVTLIHYEDMGIPKDVAKLGVRHGMWGAVKKMQSGLRSYQLARAWESSPSRSTLMARRTTKFRSIPAAGTISVSGPRDDTGAIQTHQGIDWKWVVIGGTVTVVFGFQAGLIGKALMFGASRRLGKKQVIELPSLYM